MTKSSANPVVDELFAAGAHYAYPKARRHPSARPYIFGSKGNVELFDLEKTLPALEKAAGFIENLAATGKQAVFAASKLEARGAVRATAESLGLPYVAGRWVGGTFSNFQIIKKRIEHLEQLCEDREKGTLTKYTKMERLLIDREIKRLEETFGGLRGMRSLPAALVVVDPKHEKNAVAEAKLLGIPVVALANSDCDLGDAQYPIPASDANRASIALILGKLAKSYKEGAKRAPARSPEPAPSSPSRGSDAPERVARPRRV
jgi:small subunit ribosomal protein S2